MEKQRRIEINATQRRIIELLIEDDKLSATKLAGKIGISSRSIETNIKKLKNDEILVRHGSPRRGYWEIKFIPK